MTGLQKMFEIDFLPGETVRNGRSSWCHIGCNIRNRGASCRPVASGERKQISASFVTQLPPHLPKYILSSFRFHQNINALLVCLWFSDFQTGVLQMNLFKMISFVM
jgi:hypothetical protein